MSVSVCVFVIVIACYVSNLKCSFLTDGLETKLGGGGGVETRLNTEA